MAHNPTVSQVQTAGSREQLLSRAPHPAGLPRPEPAVIFESKSKRWVLAKENTGTEDDNDYNEIYQKCIVRATTLQETANQYRKKLKLPPLDVKTEHKWDEVEASLVSACNAIEKVTASDKEMTGFTGKLKQVFRGLCENAADAQAFTSLVPQDGMGFASVLCGGFKMIFTALEHSSAYREEVYKAVEELPFVLNDHAACIKVYYQDRELHRRIAALYAALFEALNHILTWFVQSNLATGAKLLFTPKSFVQKLKDRLARVKVEAQRFRDHAGNLSHRAQDESLQLHYWNTFMHKEILVRISTLEKLHTTPQARQHQRSQRQISHSPHSKRSGTTPDDVLREFIYDASLIATDCSSLLRLQLQRNQPNLEDARIAYLQSNPQLLSWLCSDGSSLLLLNSRSHLPTSLDTAYVCAQLYTGLLAKRQSQSEQLSPMIIPLAFFCTSHSNLHRDPHACPSELAMSLLLQLIDVYRFFSTSTLHHILKSVNHSSIPSILKSFDLLLAELPETTSVILLIDGLRTFTSPPDRREKLRTVVECLVSIWRARTEAFTTPARDRAKLKFLFASSTRSDFVGDLFNNEEGEILELPATVGGLGRDNVVCGAVGVVPWSGLAPDGISFRDCPFSSDKRAF